MDDSSKHSQLRPETAPHSWGVWFADDPQQIPWPRHLGEIPDAGYLLTEFGPYGYPTDPMRLRGELEVRGLTATEGTVFAATLKGADALEKAKPTVTSR